MSDAIRRQVFFSGDVQGVGFRYTAARLAQGYRVSGFVRNLRDGRVELVAEGAPDELHRFVEAVRQAMHGCIRGVSSIDQPATGAFESFTIQHGA